MGTAQGRNTRTSIAAGNTRYRVRALHKYIIVALISLLYEPSQSRVLALTSWGVGFHRLKCTSRLLLYAVRGDSLYCTMPALHHIVKCVCLLWRAAGYLSTELQHVQGKYFTDAYLDQE